MKHLLTTILIVCSLSIHAEYSCPRRIVWGDPRTNGPVEQILQQDHQRRIAEAHNATMHTPGIGTLTLPPKVLVIMVQFKDYSFSTTKEHADSLFNAHQPLTTYLGARAAKMQLADSISHGSVATYFEDQSLGQYRPQFDIVGPVTLNNSYTDFPGSSHGASLTKLACTAVNDSVDFTQYDSDKDGYIDLVFVFYAGFGQNDCDYIDTLLVPKKDVSQLIWPHYSQASSGQFDGKTLRAFECSNELDGYLSTANPRCIVPAGSGILVHEFSHGMGLPDVYYQGALYMGTWDLMDYGCYNAGTYIPSAYNGYQRWFCQWSEPKMMNEVKNDTLRPITESGDFGVIATSGQVAGPHNNNTEYWIIENHQGLGWDTYSYGQGMILYHMQHHDWWGSSTNANSAHNGCKLVPADGTLRVQGFVGKQGDCYPYGHLDSITVASKYPITAIQQSANGDITFKVCGGTTPTGLGEEARGKRQEAIGEKVWLNGTIYIRRGNHLYNSIGQIVQ